MKSQFVGWAAAVVLLAVSGPLFGHHNSAARYDKEHPVTLTGTVTEFKMVNPHARLSFDVKDENGNIVKWPAESARI